MSQVAPITATRRSFDALVERLAESSTTLTERELLVATHWNLGEDARLREDVRFRETPWGRWMLAEDALANDAVHRWLHAERRGVMALATALTRAADLFGRRSVFCPDDPRFVLRNDEIRLAARELSRHPVVEEEVGELEKYTTCLPLHGLKAAAASEPMGQWGPGAQEQAIETLGWVRVTLPGKRLNDRMFVAAIEGHSMNDGKSGLVDGGYAVFELWPSGTKQNLNVLVRGAFTDPETGSYAVKKYVADQRDGEGHHHKVALVSLNPDKTTYPDIELVPEDDDDITVVAKVVQALSIDDYERRPHSKRRVGRRTLVGLEGLDEQAARLRRRVASFFHGGIANDDDDDDAAVDATKPWRARVVCLDAGAGGVQLEIGPLEGLPTFVKKLRVAGHARWDAFVLAANARTRPVRVSLPPGSGPWRWEAVDHEDEQDLGLDRLAVEALDPSVPFVFRVDADGVGQPVKGMNLALGQAYRVLLPPNVGDASLGDELGDGWRLWAFDLAGVVTPTTREALTSLGLDVGEAWPRLAWALFPPAAWRTNARGDSYPVFDADAEVLVRVDGVSLDDGDAAMLFVHGPAGTDRLALTGGGLVSLGRLTVGQWACALLHARTAVPSTTLLFEVATGPLRHVSAECTVAADGGVASLEVSAPPGWPVVVRWRVLHEQALAAMHAGDDGVVDLDSVGKRIEARAKRARLADLIVDCGELGRRTIVHEARASIDEVRQALTALWQQRAGQVRSCEGAWMTLLPAWFGPVAALLGYGLEPLAGADAAEASDAPHGLAAWRLTVDERIMGAIMRSATRVLVLTTDLDGVLRDARAWLDDACSTARVRAAILSDGIRWTTYRKGDRQLRRREWNLDHAIGLGSVDEMLGELAEGLF